LARKKLRVVCAEVTTRRRSRSKKAEPVFMFSCFNSCVVIIQIDFITNKKYRLIHWKRIEKKHFTLLITKHHNHHHHHHHHQPSARLCRAHRGSV
jgi:hypothetical protein